MEVVVHRFEVYLVKLDPTVGREIKKTRPCLIISPDEINSYFETIIIAPLTSSIHSFPFRVNCFFNQKKGQVALDQIRTISKERFVRKLGIIDHTTAKQVLDRLLQLFSE